MKTKGKPAGRATRLAQLGVGIAGKVAAGYAPVWFKGRKLLIGVAMIPRGEVGLIFAQMGLATAALTPQLYSALTLMVLVTTLITPPLSSGVGRFASLKAALLQFRRRLRRFGPILTD